MYFRKQLLNAATGLALSLAVFPGSMIQAESAPQRNEASPVVAMQAGDSFRLQNHAIGASWSVAGGKLNSLVVHDRMHGAELRIDVPFGLLLSDGTKYNAGSLALTGPPVRHELNPRPDAPRLADTRRGVQFDVPLESSDHLLRVTWSLVLLENSSYIRQVLTLTAGPRDVPLSRVELVDMPLAGAHVTGSVQGSPIEAGNLFVGFEDPLSQSKVTGDRATASRSAAARWAVDHLLVRDWSCAGRADAARLPHLP